MNSPSSCKTVLFFREWQFAPPSKTPTKQVTKQHWVTLKSGCIAGFLENRSSFLEDWTKFYISAISFSSPTILGTISDFHHSINALWTAPAQQTYRAGSSACITCSLSHIERTTRGFTQSHWWTSSRMRTGLWGISGFRVTSDPATLQGRLRSLSQCQCRITFPSHQNRRVKEEKRSTPYLTRDSLVWKYRRNCNWNSNTLHMGSQ